MTVMSLDMTFHVLVLSASVFVERYHRDVFSWTWFLL